jgi:tetratricopeptide (TPR) repeat protein
MKNYSFARALSILEQIRHAEDLYRGSPENYLLGFELSQLYIANEQYQNAQSLLQEILVQAEADINQEVIAACRSNLGIVSLAVANYKEAKKWLNSALQIYEALEEPSMIGQTCYHLALAHWADGESQQAVELLERSANLLTGWPLVYEALANAYGEDSKGIAYRHYANALSLEYEEDYANAISEFQKAIIQVLQNRKYIGDWGFAKAN